MDNRLGILVPYRDRGKHLKKFIDFFTNKFSHEDEYSIYVIEQVDNKLFNRGKLLNVGFHYAMEECNYFALHDIDMIPIEYDYSFPDIPTHIAKRVEQFNWSLPFRRYFGGVTLINKEHFFKINGFSNEYWGWGAEDSDLLIRCEAEHLNTTRRNCKFNSLKHSREGQKTHKYFKHNHKRVKQFGKNKYNDNYYKNEGYSTLNFDLIEQNLIQEDPPVHKISVKL